MPARALTLAVLLAAVVAGVAGCGVEDELPAATAGEPGTAGSWRALPQGPLGPRENALVLWTGDEVLVLGGSDAAPCPPNAGCVPPEVPPLADGAAYDPAEGSWRRLAQSPVPFDSAEAVVVRGTAYVWVPGSPGRPGAARAFLAYDVARDRWERLAEPSRERATRHIAAAGDRIVLFAGSHEEGERPDHEFDPDSGAWRQLPADPLSPSFDRAMAWTGDELVLFDHELVENPGSERPAVTRAASLDLETRRWRRLPDSEMLATGPWAVHGGRLVNPTLGGADGGEVNGWGRTHPYGGILDPRGGEWSALPDPPEGETAVAAGVVTDSGALFVGHQGWVLDATAGDWVRLPPLDDAIVTGRSVAAAGHDLLVFGGARWGAEPDDRRATLLADAFVWNR